MRLIRLLSLTLFFASAFGLCIAAENRHPLTFDDLISFGRVTDPQILPDGKRVAFTVTQVDKVRKTSNSDIWVVPIEGGPQGNSPRARSATTMRAGRPTGASRLSSPAAMESRRSGFWTWPAQWRMSISKRATNVTGPEGVS